eukprot:CAMPEP_0194577268 /NCGR_PEP_ID=MMETSP0292-20121207/12111_1 /TAXON_ID=39354 /ORGANISM="Heterosigma akashiwo, Strain CCMP2393" /LENGTH=461 /DNA_ID=CAMNT_0039429603 /DNA_START=96 /DNA_END=1477 /DNA_ORIENTATION=-
MARCMLLARCVVFGLLFFVFALLQPAGSTKIPLSVSPSSLLARGSSPEKTPKIVQKVQAVVEQEKLLVDDAQKFWESVVSPFWAEYNVVARLAMGVLLLGYSRVLAGPVYLYSVLQTTGWDDLMKGLGNIANQYTATRQAVKDEWPNIAEAKASIPKVKKDLAAIKKKAADTVARRNKIKEVEQKKVFETVDKGHDKTLTLSEFKMAMKKMGFQLTEQELEEEFAAFDEDGNGTMDYAEFKKFVASKEKKSKNEVNCRSVFEKMDKDHGMSLSFSEFKKSMRQMGFKFTDAELRQDFEAFDADHSGDISFPEFRKFVESKERGVNKELAQLEQLLEEERKELRRLNRDLEALNRATDSFGAIFAAADLASVADLFEEITEVFAYVAAGTIEGPLGRLFQAYNVGLFLGATAHRTGALALAPLAGGLAAVESLAPQTVEFLGKLGEQGARWGGVAAAYVLLA